MAPRPDEPHVFQRQTELSAGFEKAFDFHHAWLRRSGLLDRPWFIMASAPEPTLPKEFPPDTVYAYVKHAGRSAKLIGLPNADLTLLSEFWSRREDGVDRGRVLLVRRKLPVLSKMFRRFERPLGNNLDLLREERDSYTISVAGSLFSDGSKDSRPSMTVPMLCFAIAHGIPSITLAGMSLDRGGYAYDQSNAPRKHVREDRLVLEAIAKRYPQVVTTERGLHDRVGVRLSVT